MNEQITMDRLTGLHGTAVYDRNGEKIGKVEEIYYDEQTDQPEWVGIGTGFFGMKRVLVPARGLTTADDGVTVPYDKEMVKDSPDIDSDPIDPSSEQALHSYYGTAHVSGGSAPVASEPDRQTRVETPGEQAVTRSEEELLVDKRSVDAGSVRLRKWVETEPVQTNIELQRETVHVHREPVDQVVSGAEIGEQTIEVPLRDEEAVVDKQVVAKERVSLDKAVEQRTETISDDVRKERVEIDGDDGDLQPRERY